MKCISCKKDFRKGSVFRCPQCSKETITRCSECKKNVTSYKCKCGFIGP